MTRGHLAKEEHVQSEQKMEMSWGRGHIVGGVSLEAERAVGVRRMPPSASPTAVRTENWVLGGGEPCFSQGTEEMEVKEHPGHLSKNGSFLSEKNSLK